MCMLQSKNWTRLSEKKQLKMRGVARSSFIVEAFWRYVARAAHDKLCETTDRREMYQPNYNDELLLRLVVLLDWCRRYDAAFAPKRRPSLYCVWLYLCWCWDHSYRDFVRRDGFHVWNMTSCASFSKSDRRVGIQQSEPSIAGPQHSHQNGTDSLA